MATAGMFLFAAWVILVNAEPFCEGLIGTGRAFHINEFVLVQWLAPIASEAPEFTVALVFAWRGQAGMALGSLLSAKLNQWTLLVGMIPGAYAISHGSLNHPMPIDSTQIMEVLLTAAQSMLGLALLAGLRLSLGGAILLFGLFAGQLVLPVISRWAPILAAWIPPTQIHAAFSLIYLASAATVMVEHPRRFVGLARGLWGEKPPAPAEKPRAFAHTAGR
jgi:cation:H+ antiporter